MASEMQARPKLFDPEFRAFKLVFYPHKYINRVRDVFEGLRLIFPSQRVRLWNAQEKIARLIRLIPLD